MQTSQPAVARGGPSNPMWRLLAPIVAAETWSATWFLVSTLFVGLWWFTVVAVVAVLGFATLVLGIGVPLLVASIALARAAADSERRRLATIGVELPRSGPADRPPARGWARLRSELRDPTTFRTVGHVLLLIVLGPIWFSLAVSTWSVPLSLLATPLLVGAGFHPTASSEAGGWEIAVDDMTAAGIAAALGAVLLPLAPRIIGGLARTHAGLAGRLLDTTTEVAR